MLKPVFTNASIFKGIDDFEKNKIEQIMQKLAYAGEQFVNTARHTDSYRDRTSNLRSSIGYAIGYNGAIKKIDVKGKAEGVSRARELAKEIVNENKRGFVLIGYAGMEYAAAVESKGYDVITGSVPETENLLQSLMMELMGK